MRIKDGILYFIISIYLILLPLLPSKLMINGHGFKADYVLALIIIFYIVKILLFTNTRDNLKLGIKDIVKSSFGIFVIVLILVMFFSITYSVEKKLALSETLRFLSYIILYFIIKYELEWNKAFKWFSKSLFIVSGISCFYGLFQYTVNSKLHGMFSSSAQYRVSSFYENPNTFAGMLILIIFPVIMISIAEKKRVKKVVYILLACSIFINVLLTGSRNALLAFGIGCFILTLLYSKRIIILLASFGVISMLLPTVHQRVKDIFDFSQDFTRIRLWNTAFTMIKEHPIFGVGNGNFVSLYDSYVEKYPKLYIYYEYKRFPSHNSYLKVESELGILGIIAFIGSIVSIIISINKCYTKVENKFIKFFYLGFLASTYAFLFMNFFDNLFFIPKCVSLFWVLFSICESILYNLKKKNNFDIIKSEYEF